MGSTVKLANDLYLETSSIVHNGKLLSNILYPIGSIYLSVNSINPTNFFGGTWEALPQDYYLITAPITQTNIGKGGSWYTDDTVLTIDQIPPHTHNWYGAIDGGSDVGRQIDRFMLNGYGNARWWGNLYKMDNTGGGQGHNHKYQPPYYQVYAWKRVS